MPPPKLKMHRAPNSGKLKAIPRPQPMPSTSQDHGAQSQDQREAQEKFELELAWCIQRLEESLNSGKLNEKQNRDTLKTLTTLRSSAQPTVKKRQLMRTTFGDYRAKMSEDEKTYSINPNSFKFLGSGRSSNKAYFVKKAAIVEGEKNFKFNFNIDSKMDDLSLEDEKKVEKSSVVAPSKIDLPSSGSGFQFNFAVDTDETSNE